MPKKAYYPDGIIGSVCGSVSAKRAAEVKLLLRIMGGSFTIAQAEDEILANKGLYPSLSKTITIDRSDAMNRARRLALRAAISHIKSREKDSPTRHRVFLSFQDPSDRVWRYHNATSLMKFKHPQRQILKSYEDRAHSAISKLNEMEEFVKLL